MKEISEIRQIKTTHPELGELIKSVKFTYDGDRYATLEEAIEDGDKSKSEQDIYCLGVKAQNDNAKALIDEEYQKAIEEWLKLKPTPKEFIPIQLDLSPFVGRGIITKEYVPNQEQKQGAAITALMSATHEEIEQIKILLQII